MELGGAPTRRGVELVRHAAGDDPLGSVNLNQAG